MLTSGDMPQPREVVQFAHQRVLASISERGGIISELRGIEDRHRFSRTPGDSVRQAELEERLLRNMEIFRQKIVSNLPEAKAWVEIAKETYEATLKSQRNSDGYPITPTDRSRDQVDIEGAKRSLTDAKENLAKVSGLNPSVPVNSSKTPR